MLKDAVLRYYRNYSLIPGACFVWKAPSDQLPIPLLNICWT
jgi:hypothetical protein